MNDLANTLAARLPQHPIDQTDLPVWGIGLDGRHVKIEGDERLPIAFEHWRADACDHARVIIIRFVNAGGGVMHQACCKDCGTTSTQFLKKDDAERQGIAVEFTKDQAASISNRYRSERKAALDGIANAAAERMQPVNRSRNDDYLRSPQWQRRRSKIFQRCGHLCEGCLTNPATDVHHRTYANYGNEFAFELLALCRDCHERLHGTEAA